MYIGSPPGGGRSDSGGLFVEEFFVFSLEQWVSYLVSVSLSSRPGGRSQECFV